MSENLTKEYVLSLLKVTNDDPFSNITVKEVAKDLRCSERTANDIFRRDDFPSVNIGKTKTITKLAYCLWKMERRN